MNLEDLLKEGLIERAPVNLELVKELLALAERDLEDAEGSLQRKRYDWAYAIAYNSMLQAGRAFMHSRGFRPHAASTHLATVKFVQVELSHRFGILVKIFNKCRIKRHKVIYERAGLISPNEAEEAVKHARQLIAEIKKIIK
jgi:uncharacterized protein (UPF0332 family)